MKNTIPFLTFIVLIISMPTQCLWAQEKKIDLQEIDLFVSNHIKDKNFSGSILIAEGGDTIYAKSTGNLSLESQDAITIHTKFGIASITKLFTTIVILQLVEEQLLNLEEPIVKLLPDIDFEYGNLITPHHLLLNISGLPDENNVDYAVLNSPSEMVLRALKTNQQIKPGTYNYNNVDYFLLGLIIERITKTSWQSAVEKRILIPLKMKDTGFLAKGHYPDDFAFSYQIDSDGNAIADPLFYIENYYAAGSMFSTLEDLLKLDQALYKDYLLTESSKELMFRSYPQYNYTGYSVWTYTYPFLDSKPIVMERRGGILGTNGVLMRILDQNKTIIILSNNNQFQPDSFGDPANLREGLLRVVAD